MNKPRFRFLNDTAGSVTVETLLMLPLLIWAYIAVVVYFDTFRTQIISLRAAYTIGDIVSRQTAELDGAYFTGLNKVYDYLINTDEATSIRVSLLVWDDVDDAYAVTWSCTTKSQPKMTNIDANNYADRLPSIPVGDPLFVVETNVDYVPIFNIGIGSQNFRQLISTRARISGPVPVPSC